MKKLSALIVLILFIITSFSLKQNLKSNDGFKIIKPNDWFDYLDSDLKKNLEKYELTDQRIDELMITHRGSIKMAVYMKYDASVYPGIIPTIQNGDVKQYSQYE